MKNFKINNTYKMTFITDADLQVDYKCIKRTAKTATFTNGDETITRKIKSFDDYEYVVLGNYSMAPSIRA